jgi:hypothetical protein
MQFSSIQSPSIDRLRDARTYHCGTITLSDSCSLEWPMDGVKWRGIVLKRANILNLIATCQHHRAAAAVVIVNNQSNGWKGEAPRMQLTF